MHLRHLLRLSLCLFEGLSLFFPSQCRMFPEEYPWSLQRHWKPSEKKFQKRYERGFNINYLKGCQTNQSIPKQPDFLFYLLRSWSKEKLWYGVPSQNCEGLYRGWSSPQADNYKKPLHLPTKSKLYKSWWIYATH